MACNDHGRFLEIADVIYRLELTILKGVMERRSDDSTWAHFVVEVRNYSYAVYKILIIIRRFTPF